MQHTRQPAMGDIPHTLSCAALKSSVDRANSSKLTSGATFIFLEWICKILERASSFGCGNSTLRSSRPDRMSAGSKISARFVAAMTCNPGEPSGQKHVAQHAPVTMSYSMRTLVARVETHFDVFIAAKAI